MDNNQQVSHRGDENENSAPHIGFRLDADLPPAYHPQNQQSTPNFSLASNSPPKPPGVDVVVSSQPKIVSVGTWHGLPHKPMTNFTCPNCSKVMSTKVEHKVTGKTHCWALIFFCLLCWPCVCVPYCNNSCQTAEHFCTECGTYMGNSENFK